MTSTSQRRLYFSRLEAQVAGSGTPLIGVGRNDETSDCVLTNEKPGIQSEPKVV